MNIYSEKINKIKTNVLSLRLDDQLKNDSIVIRLKKNYPYHFFCDLNKSDNKIRYIFSKYEIDSIETFSWNDESLMLGTVNIDKNIGKIYFLNLSLNENDLEENDSSLYYLNKFTTVCKEKYFKITHSNDDINIQLLSNKLEEKKNNNDKAIEEQIHRIFSGVELKRVSNYLL